jgi:hypothetical protein
MPAAMTAPAMPAPAVMTVPLAAAAMPAMALAAPACAELIGAMQQIIGLQLERSSARLRILRGKRGRHCGTERQRRSEHDSNRPHFLVLLFAGIPPARAI